MNHAPYADARRDVESLAPASAVHFASTSTVHRLKRRQSPLERFVSSQFGVAFDKREGPWTNQGEALAMLGGLVLVFTSFALPKANISLCGYTEYASNAQTLPYYASATASASSLIWSTVVSARHERNKIMKTLRCILGVVPAMTMIGTFMFPRCKWTWHQSSVLAWASSVSGAMAFELLVRACDALTAKPVSERVVHSALVLPHIVWVLGMLRAKKYYYNSTEQYEFFGAEIMCTMSFAWWSLSKHRAGTFPAQPDARVYTWREYCLVDGASGAALLCVYRFIQFKLCAAWGQY